jgi:hypothetical protein
MNIKKIAAVAAIALATAVSSHAELRYGPVVGANFTNLKFKQTLAGTEGATGVSAGVQTELMFPGVGFGLDLGLVYNWTGGYVNLGDKPIWSTSGFGRERVSIHELTIPFHLRFKWTRMSGLEDYIAPFVYGGPDFNIQLAGANPKEGGVKAFDYSGGDISLTAGLGFEVLKHWQISGAYTWGMTYAVKTNLLTDYSARCRGWQVRLSYLF